jgi:tetratricopeptide (TPR) repeat protein
VKIKSLFRQATALALCLAAVPAMADGSDKGWSDGLAGAYLAARQASVTADYANAATYYTEALVRDPGNPLLLENALLAQIGLGAIDRAVPIARVLKQSGSTSQMADLVLLADQLKREAYDEVAADFAAGRDLGPLLTGLVKAWADLGQGRANDALAGFDTLSKGAGLTSFAMYHKALALASAGDFEGADQILSGKAVGPITLDRRGILAQAEVLSQLERNPDAIALIDSAFDVKLDPGMKAMRDRLVAGEVLPFDIARTALEGEAEAFLSLAEALSGDAEDEITLIYARIADYLRPDNADAILLAGEILTHQEQYDLATQTFNRVPADNPAFVKAEIDRADALSRAGKEDAALEVMAQLAKGHPEAPVVLVTLGDMYRSQERYADAIIAYDQAIVGLGEPSPAHWVVYYTRGIAYERTGNMDQAETDMRLALKLNPDQPQVLNYLGYSFVDSNRNLEEALAMIEKAVAARPDDGYIVDSLGWALYRLGRTTDALVPMERAVELEAVDPILNDHLGDVYWSVGRKLEAEFQWHRALSFKPTAKDEARIRRKLEVGLDVVLEEEGAVPGAVTADGN